LIGLHLPFRFDPDRLRADLATARRLPWSPHYNERDFGGDWSGIALHSASGDPADLIAFPPGQPAFRETPLLQQCPYFRQVLATFECPLKSVRLLSLAPQSFIREHSDHALGYDDGEIRIHIPVETNPDVEFYVAGERLLLEEGHSYFINVNLPHRVNNRGTSGRVHLVVDAEVNEWVHALFREGETPRAIPRSARPPRNVDDFRRHVLADPALQSQLQALGNRAQFCATAMQTGSALGYDFHDGDVDAAFRCGPLTAKPDDPPVAPGWTPVRVFFRDRTPFAEWIWTGPHRFTEPFFESSVRVALRHPFTKFFRRELPLDHTPESAAPAGFIFHVSRCGSTLVAQMLAAAASHHVLSEPPPVDEVLQAHTQIPGLTREEQIRWLRQIVHALALGRAAQEDRVFIKLDAWHSTYLPLIREAFPETPWILVFRDPLEVMVSQLTQPGKIALNGNLPDAIAGFYRAGLEGAGTPGGLFIDYSELPEALFGPVANHFALTLSESDRARMREVAVYDAKTPSLQFEPDSQDKHIQATAAVRELCDERLNPLYRALLAASARKWPVNKLGSHQDLSCDPLRL
jgi:hypothetical protein